MQAKDKVNALPSELSLKSLALREDHTKNIYIFTYIFQLLLQNVLSVRNFFQISRFFRLR